MQTSGTYNFGAPESRQLIDEAFERIGVVPALLVPQQIHAAQRSINFILQEWVNKGNNLWTVQQGNIALKANQVAYALPLGAIDVKTVVLRTMISRILGGTPFSYADGFPDGNAANAFDGNPATACVQTNINGFIGYSWGAARKMPSMVGVQAQTTVTYALVVEYSLDNSSPDAANWLPLLTIPRQTYTQNSLQWYSIRVPIAVNQIRIRETEGAILAIEELYFENFTQDMYMSRFSESEYTSFPNKYLVSRPSGYWVDRQINPIIYLYPAPNGQYPMLYFTYWQAMQDIGNMANLPQIPARFLEALVAALASKLSIKYSREFQISDAHIDRLGALAQDAYRVAASEDRERVPTRFYQNGDLTGLGGN